MRRAAHEGMTIGCKSTTGKCYGLSMKKSLAKPVYLCARGSNWDGRLAHTERPAKARAARVTGLCRLDKEMFCARFARAG